MPAARNVPQAIPAAVGREQVQVVSAAECPDSGGGNATIKRNGTSVQPTVGALPPAPAAPAVAMTRDAASALHACVLPEKSRVLPVPVGTDSRTRIADSIPAENPPALPAISAACADRPFPAPRMPIPAPELVPHTNPSRKEPLALQVGVNALTRNQDFAPAALLLVRELGSAGWSAVGAAGTAATEHPTIMVRAAAAAEPGPTPSRISFPVFAPAAQEIVASGAGNRLALPWQGTNVTGTVGGAQYSLGPREREAELQELRRGFYRFLAIPVDE